MPPQKRARGITIHERGSNPPTKGRTKHPIGGQSKDRRPTSERVAANCQDTLSNPEDN